MKNVITSFLVSLNFEPDNSSYRKFSGALNQAEADVATHTSGMARKVIEVQGAITGAFLGVSAAILGVVDRTAMADQGYRLMGLRMMMTTEQARKLSIITKTLGASLEEIIWDPELHARANVLSQDMDRMTKQLGPGFEGSMRSIRDFRAEFGRLEVGLQFLGMRFTEDLWAKLMPGEAGKSFHDWITWAEDHIPEWSGKLVGYAVPALENTWKIAKATGEAVEQGAIAFTNLVGVLSGDNSIESATFSFDNLAKAISHVGEFMADFVTQISKGEKFLGELASGSALMASGKLTEAAEAFGLARKDLKTGTGAMIGGAVGAAVGTIGGPIGIVAGGAIGAAGGNLIGKAAQETGDRPTDAQALIAEIKKYGDLGALKREAAGALQTSKEIWSNIGESYGAIMRHEGFNGAKAAINQPMQAAQPAQPAGALNQSIAQPTPAPAGSISASPDLVGQLAAAITKVETGGKSDSIAARNNNPGNLRTWGDYPTEGGYAKFPDMETGMAALRKQIELNISRGLSLNEFFAGVDKGYPGFASKKAGNDPESYTATVAKALGGLSIDIPLNQIVMPAPVVAPPAPPPTLIPPPGQESPAPIARPIAYTVPLQIDRGSLVRPLAPSANDSAPQPQFPGGIAQRWPEMAPQSILPSNADAQLAAAFAAMQRPVVSNPSTSTSQSITMGDIYVSVTEPGASADEIARLTRREVAKALGAQTQFDIPQLRAAY
ncbi:MAG: hypothetical protein WBY44_28740 [Bryobacteraceae bacterium]